MTCQECERIKKRADAVNESYRNMAKLVDRWVQRENTATRVLNLIEKGQFALAKEIAAKEMDFKRAEQ